MSKQSEAKAAQAAQVYRITPDTCSNCVHYRSTFVSSSYGASTWVEEKDKRCGLGEFAVRKTAVCARHEAKA